MVSPFPHLLMNRFHITTPELLAIRSGIVSEDLTSTGASHVPATALLLPFLPVQ